MGKEFISFEVKTGMKNIIGRDLITDDFIAIYELVKNSYDAYASKVIISFLADEIIIADNGKGMSVTDIKDKWFAVAYSAKRDGSEDTDDERSSHLNNLKSRRFYAGAKGVGRFSCDRLGNNLQLISQKNESDISHTINIEWSEFEKNSKQNFGDIKIPMESDIKVNNFPDNASHGTILRITDLNSIWTENKINDLKRSLEKLINPFLEENDFQIEIIASIFSIKGVLSNSILKVLDLKTTQVNVVIHEDTITTKLTDRGTLIYHIEEPNKDQDLIDNLDISLYFLNRSAKINFGKIMDIEPVNYGNVFLFKNGFRVQPYGNVGDDSWEIDRRKQQGYNRFLGTRDLFGKVDLTTENFNEFKEVSSRDGGLVESAGKAYLFELFFEKALKRLERYVVGVLWGEGFKRKNYFVTDDVAAQIRSNLKGDKDNDTYDDVKHNIGSKIDFVNLIKSLSDDNNIKILKYDKDLVNLVNEQLDIIQPKFIQELEKIAEKTKDENLLDQIKLTEENLNKLIAEKEHAEKKAAEEERKRIEAEKKVAEEERKRIEAEKKAAEEEEKRRRAELENARREQEKLQAIVDKLRAEENVRKEAEKRIAEEEKNKSLSEKLSIESQKNQYLNATRKTLSEDADQLVHTIDLYVGNASTYVNELLKDETLNRETKDNLYNIKNNIDKALKVSEIIIKSNFDYKHTSQRIELTKYIAEYLEDLGVSRKKLRIQVGNTIDHYSFLNPIDIDIILDNLVSNSVKAKSKNILVTFHKNLDKSVMMEYSDDGNGVPEILANNPHSIFELGVRESTEKGSGIGMYDVKKRMQFMNGDIEFAGNNKHLKGASFKLTFK